MSPLKTAAVVFVIGNILGGCSTLEEKVAAHSQHLTTDNVNGRLIRVVDHSDLTELRYNGRGMQIQVHYFGDLPLNSEAEQSADKGKHIALVDLAATVDLTRDQWKPVFEAWFHRAAAIPVNQILHPEAVTVNKQQIWQYTVVIASASSESRYIRAYLIPECKHAIVIQSRGWTSADSSSYKPYLDELATCVDINESR